METDPEKIRELRRNQPKLKSEKEFWDQVERHIGRRPKPLYQKPELSSSGPKAEVVSSSPTNG
ncbi:MAG: hypothetical protein ACI8UO_000231 [Verrucomicrobiales bacterium]|jgi:hypothetical protein